MAEQSKEKQANEQAKAQNLLLVGEKKKRCTAKTKRKKNKDSNEDESK